MRFLTSFGMTNLYVEYESVLVSMNIETKTLSFLNISMSFRMKRSEMRNLSNSSIKRSVE